MATRRSFAGNFVSVKMTHLPLDHHIEYRIIPDVFISSEFVAKYECMPHG